MSTNKTPNYQLHSWLPDDEFHVAEINENFSGLDAAVGGKADKAEVAQKVGLVTGTYTGTGGTQQIQLGFKPRLVILMAIPGYLTDVPHYGLAYADRSFSSYLVINDVGFSAKADNSVNLNHDGWTYLYAAFR